MNPPTMACLFLALPLSATASMEWPQFGGPHRNFKSDITGLASSWPASGPKRVWERNLGEGYSGISIDGNVLYTMYRQGNDEVVIAADTPTGKTLWEHREPAPILPGMSMENGPGPHATPLVTNDMVCVAGILARLQCLDKKTGQVRWSHDLYKEFDGSFMVRGYSSSPLAYKNTLLIQVGGRGHSVMAFNQKDGAVVWKKQNFAESPSSPIVIDFAGQDQLVVFMSEEIAGLHPNSGELLWTHPHSTNFGLNISMPVWGDDNILFMTSAYNGGARAIQLTREGDKTSVKELWAHKRMRVHIGDVIRLGDYVYGSSGDFGPAPLTAVEVKTGKVAWQDRTFSKANLLYADGKAIILDEDGTLALAKLSPQGLSVLAKASLLKHNAWTAPSLAGTRLYVRDRSEMMALELGSSSR